MRCVFDVETAPLPDAADYLPDDISAPANFKDPGKIATYIAEARVKQLAEAALDPDLCQVVAIGWKVDDDPVVSICGEPEDYMLHYLFDIIKQAGAGNAWRSLVGFNCLGFDFPVLFRRAQYLGIKAPHVQIDKYRHPDVVDLQSVLSFNGAKKFRSLSFYAKRFKLDVPDEVSGADIGALVQAGNWAAVQAHVEADVMKTDLLAKKLGL